jgi:thioredoxin 2
MSDLQMIRCRSCGATNRVPLEKIAQGLQPVCGRCQTALPVDNKPVTVTDATFAAEVERSPLPVLLDMWARRRESSHGGALPRPEHSDPAGA